MFYTRQVDIERYVSLKKILKASKEIIDISYLKINAGSLYTTKVSLSARRTHTCCLIYLFRDLELVVEWLLKHEMQLKSM